MNLTLQKLEKLGHSLAKVTEENAGLKQQNQRLFTEKRNLEVILEKVTILVHLLKKFVNISREFKW